MSRIQIFILAMITVWSLSMWAIVYKKTVTPVAINVTLTDDFKEWEAQGRLILIDTIMDNPEMADARINWNKTPVDLQSLGKTTMQIQNQAYGFEKMPLPTIRFIAMRGDANGLYVPQDKTIFINSKMKWDELPFERFLSVMMHENMHHIMTQGMHYLNDNNHQLYNDFMMLSHVAYRAQYMGDTVSHKHGDDNPQEWVAYRTERAARFAGLLESDLPSWDISARMGEISILHSDANF